MSEDGKALIWLAMLALASAAAISFGLLLWLRPLLTRYTLAKPTTRSSHKVPTPQGGGIAIVVATVLVVGVVSITVPGMANNPVELATVLASAVLLAIVGVVDDLRPLEPAPRLLLQVIVVAAVLWALPTELRVFPAIPRWLEQLMLFATAVWFVNLVNFMDGIDWMTVAEIVPITAALALFGFADMLPSYATLLAAALCGGVVGFAPFNRPVARLFLGDVGSLPIGLLLVWLLIVLAGNGHLVAALLLPLYYVTDTTITLLVRFVHGEQLTQAHRSHFYQRATNNGLCVTRIIGRVFITNIFLVVLAALSLIIQPLPAQIFLIVAGSAAVGLLLWSFGQRPGGYGP